MPSNEDEPVDIEVPVSEDTLPQEEEQPSIEHQRRIEALRNDILARFEMEYSELVRAFSSIDKERDEAIFLEDRQILRDRLLDGLLASFDSKTERYNYRQLFLDIVEGVYRIQASAAEAAIVLQKKINKLNESRMSGPEQQDEWDHRRFLARVSLISELHMTNELLKVVGVEYKDEIMRAFIRRALPEVSP